MNISSQNFVDMLIHLRNWDMKKCLLLHIVFFKRKEEVMTQ